MFCWKLYNQNVRSRRKTKWRWWLNRISYLHVNNRSKKIFDLINHWLCLRANRLIWSTIQLIVIYLICFSIRFILKMISSIEVFVFILKINLELICNYPLWSLNNNIINMKWHSWRSSFLFFIYRVNESRRASIVILRIVRSLHLLVCQWILIV
jgi:hypothetical protein